MAGTKRFDPDEALENAMRVFWELGYEGTSYAQLMDATGLNKSSLYNAFGDKQALYDRCLERFSEMFGEKLRERLDADRFEDAVGGFFEQLLDRFKCSKSPGGCMATAAALEIGGGHDTLGSRIKSQFENMRTAMKLRSDRAVADGELPAETDTEALASFLLAMTRGLAALHRGYDDTAVAEQAARAISQVLKAPPLKN